MKRLIIFLLTVFCVSMSACSVFREAPEEPFCRVVTSISIRADNGETPGVWHYSHPGKPEKVLWYLRRVNSWDRLRSDPAELTGTRYRITVRFSDGQEKHYEQIGRSYFRKPEGTWWVISPDTGVGLALLLAVVPSDAI